MSILKNIAFTAIITTEGRQREFNFRKQSAAQVPTYHVDVTDARGNRIQFVIFHGATGWTVTGAMLPSWVTGYAAAIGQVIDQYGA